MICKYKNCIFGNTEIPEGTEVLVGKQWCHPECAKIRENITSIIDLFTKYMNEDVIYAQLVKTINTMIFVKGIDSEMIEYGLRYYIHKKKKINYPGGLYYMIQDKEVQNYWNTVLNNRARTKAATAIEINDAPKIFGYSKQKKKTLEDLIGGSE